MKQANYYNGGHLRLRVLISLGTITIDSEFSRGTLDRCHPSGAIPSNHSGSTVPLDHIFILLVRKPNSMSKQEISSLDKIRTSPLIHVDTVFDP